VDADVDARPGDRDGEHEEEGRAAGDEPGKHTRTGERDRGVAGRERARVRRGDERVRLREARGRAGAADRGLERAREPLRGRGRDERPEEDLGPAAQDCEDERDREPDEPVRAGEREALEDRVEEAVTMADRPALELAV
jgi:hypothetical protein